MAGGAEMDVDGAQFDGAVFAELVKNFLRAFDIDAEFCFFFAGGGIGVRFGVNIGIDAQGGFRGFALLFCDA